MLSRLSILLDICSTRVFQFPSASRGREKKRRRRRRRRRGGRSCGHPRRHRKSRVLKKLGVARGFFSGNDIPHSVYVSSSTSPSPWLAFTIDDRTGQCYVSETAECTTTDASLMGTSPLRSLPFHPPLLPIPNCTNLDNLPSYSSNIFAYDLFIIVSHNFYNNIRDNRREKERKDVTKLCNQISSSIQFASRGMHIFRDF